AMTIADLAHGAEIAVRRRNAARRCANDRFGHEGGHGFRADALEFGFQLGGKAAYEGIIALIVLLLTVGESRRDMAERFRQQRRIRRTAVGVAADGQRAKRVAVIALPAGNEMRAARLADLDEIL